MVPIIAAIRLGTVESGVDVSTIVERKVRKKSRELSMDATKSGMNIRRRFWSE
jgi:hypothetical protein